MDPQTPDQPNPPIPPGPPIDPPSPSPSPPPVEINAMADNDNHHGASGANKPFDFNGDRKDARRWLGLVENYILLNRDIYDTDEHKVRFACSYMSKGSGGIFSNAILEAQKVRLMAPTPLAWDYTWRTFEENFKKEFISTDRVAEAFQELQEYKHNPEKMRADTFVHNFQRLALEANITDYNVLRSLFRNNISSALRTLIISQEPFAGAPNIQNYYDAAIRYGNNLDNIRKDHTVKKPTQFFRKKYSKPRKHFNRRYQANEMEIDSDSEEEEQNEHEIFNINLMQFKQLTKQQRQNAIDKRLCFFCQKPGHMANRCPEKQNSKPKFGNNKNSSRRFPGHRQRFKPRINTMEMDEDEYDDDNQFTLEEQAFQINKMITNLNDEDRNNLFDMMDNLPNDEQDYDDYGSYDPGNF